MGKNALLYICRERDRQTDRQTDLGNSKIISCRCWESVTVLSLCLDPINMNSVLVIFKVSLFALSQ